MTQKVTKEFPGRQRCPLILIGQDGGGKEVRGLGLSRGFIVRTLMLQMLIKHLLNQCLGQGLR